MPLRKHKASIKFTNGVQGKVDHKVLPKEHLITLENGRFTKLGAIDKRTGFALIDKSASDIVDYKNSIVARNVIIGDRASAGTVSTGTSYNFGAGEFIGDKGYSEGIDYTMLPVSKGSTVRQEDSNTAISSDGKYACVTFVDVDWDQTNDKKVYNKKFSIIDRETNTVVESDIKIGIARYSGNNGRRMKPIWISAQSKFYIFGEEEGALKVWVVDPATNPIVVKNTAGTTTKVGTDILATGNYPLTIDSDHQLAAASFDVCDSATTSKVNIAAIQGETVPLNSPGATRANPCVVTSDGHPFADGDYVTFAGVAGMTQLNGNKYLVANKTTNTFELSGIDSSAFGAWTSAGTAASSRLRYYQFTAPSTLSSSIWSTVVSGVYSPHLAIHRAGVTGTHANKLSLAHKDGNNIHLTTFAEASGTTATVNVGAGTGHVRGVFRDSLNPRVTATDDVQFIFEVGNETMGSSADNCQVVQIDGIHADINSAMGCFKFLSKKSKLAFVLGRGPVSIGIYHDDNTEVSNQSDQPIKSIQIIDTDTNDHPERYSANVTNFNTGADSIPQNMFNGATDVTATRPCTSLSSQTLTVTFEPPIVYSTSIKVFFGANPSGPDYAWRLNGTGAFTGIGTGTGHARVDVVASGSGTMTQIEFKKASSTVAVYGIEVDGSYLYDPHSPCWVRDHLPISTFDQDYNVDVFQSASVSGVAGADHLNGDAVAIPVGNSFDRFGLAGTVILNSITTLFDFRQYNVERIDVPAPSKGMLHDILYLADKGLFQYDGDKFHAINFLDRPMVGAALVTTTGLLGNSAGGIYYYKVAYEWTDAQGNLHQSEPSTGVTVTCDGSNEQVNITIADLDYDGFNTAPHIQQSYRSPIRAAVYRTQEGGSLYNQIMSVPLGGVDGGIIVVRDNISDTVAGAGKFLYTDSGELANKPPPASARYVTAHRDRVFVIGKDDVIYYSKLVNDGFGVGFNEALRIKTPDNISDPPTALGSMDGNLFIFTEKSIYIVGGEGPDNLGAGGFYEVKKIPSLVGATRGSPVKMTDKGLFFVSDNGLGKRIYLLGRNMAVTHAGSAVEDILNPVGGTSYTVRDIAVMPEQETILFLLNQISGTASGAKIISFNFGVGQWGLDTILDTYDAGAGGSFGFSTVKDKKRLYISLLHHVSNKNPRVYSETNTHKDNSVYVPLKIKTAWINLAGIQSYQRVYAFHVLGESIDKHVLTVNVYYDYDTSTVVDSYTFTTSSATDALLQFRGHLSKQKCQAIQFEIVDADNSGTTDEGYTITEIALEMGLREDGYKQANAKLNSTSTIGSN